MSLAALGWIGFVILACTDEEAMVSGDRYSGGGCPSGETCAPPPSAGGSPYFVATQTPGAPMSSGELPPVATGATTSVRLVQQFPPEDRWGDDGVRAVSDAVFVAEGLSITSSAGSATLIGSTAGSYTLRAENEAGELYDQIRLRVVDATSVIARPLVGLPGLANFEVGPESGWRVWPGTELHFVERATSATGRVLVSLDSEYDSHYGSAVAPVVGPLEIEVTAGELTRTTTFELATEVDSFVVYFTDPCGRWAGEMCLFGEQGGAPIVGAPIRITDDDDREPYELDPVLPCIGQREEGREITFELGDRTWTTLVPPFEDDCFAP